ncbi:MAG TPA: hypothetical protein VMR00_05815 [Streptosporangiaceae bacterium]|nr:hypothetical protein [Streptosporangiaceae bacterium]
MQTLDRIRPQAAACPYAGTSVSSAGTARAVIAQARRRQRRRLTATVIALVLAAGCVAGVLAAVSGNQSPAGSATSGAGFGPGPGPDAVSATVLMYPVRAPASAPLGTGLAAYVGNLSTGHLSERKLPGIINCNCGQPLVDAVGNWLVYVNDQNTVSAVPAGLTGKARILGLTNMFMPAATPGQVWLEYQTNGPTVVRSVPVAGGPAGPPVSLPLGTALIEGTAAGLLLQQDSNTGVLELWSPGRAPVRLPQSAGAEVLASTPRLVAYGARCRSVAPPSSVPAAGVGACGTLLAYNIAAGSLASFPAPRRTAGWFGASGGATPAAVSPDGTMIAAMDLTSAVGGAERLFVLPAGGGRPRLVPLAGGQQLTWSLDGRWLFYQGAGDRLWTYQPATGQVRKSTMPCCSYWAMTALPGGR